MGISFRNEASRKPHAKSSAVHRPGEAAWVEQRVVSNGG
jgi:hypothetical protein